MRWIVGGKAVERQAVRHPDGTLRDGAPGQRRELCRIDRTFRQSTVCMNVAAEDDHPRHGLKRQSDPWRTRGRDLQRSAARYHPLFLFNQFGDLDDVPSAPATSIALTVGPSGTRRRALPGTQPVAISRGRRLRLRASTITEAEGFLYGSVCQRTRFFSKVAISSRDPLAVEAALLRQLQLSGWRLTKASAPRRLGSPCRFHRSRPAERVVAFYNHRSGTEHQGR